jgi:hypothetical protein
VNAGKILRGPGCSQLSIMEGSQGSLSGDGIFGPLCMTHHHAAAPHLSRSERHTIVIIMCLILIFSINSSNTSDEQPHGALAEWLSRMTRNHIPSGAQVRVLQASQIAFFLLFYFGGVVLWW